MKACVRCVGVLALAVRGYEGGWGGLEGGLGGGSLSGLCLTKRLECTGTEPGSRSPLLLCPLPSFSYFSFFHCSFFITPTPPPPPPGSFFMPSDCRLFLSQPLQAGLLERNKSLMTLFFGLLTRQARARAKKQAGRQWTRPPQPSQAQV